MINIVVYPLTGLWGYGRNYNADVDEETNLRWDIVSGKVVLLF